MNTGETGEPPQSGGTGAAYLGLVLIWSTTPLAVVVSLRDLDAVWALAVRMVVAAVLAQVLLQLAGLRLAADRAALKRYGIGAISMFGAMLFTYLGARHLPSGLISILFGLSPLAVGVIGRFCFNGARLLALQWLGLLLALLGLALIFLQAGQLASLDTVSVLFVLAGVMCYAFSSLWLKQLPEALPPLVQTAGALWVSAAAAVLVLPLLGSGLPTQWPGAASLTALLYSACMGSIVAMLLYFFLLQRISVGSMALMPLLTPVLALLLGILINHERFDLRVLWGMGLILLGLGAYYLRELRRLTARAALA